MVLPRAWLAAAAATLLVVAPARGEAPAPAPEAAAPDPRVQRIVDKWAKRKSLRGVTVGVAVRDTTDGRLLAALAPDPMLNPASGTKLLTTAAALVLLPLETRWTTTVHGELGAEGALVGPLWLRGGGDPKLLAGHLDQLAADLAAAGLKSAAHGLVVDPRVFDADNLPPAYDQKDTDAGYRPTIGAASVNFGAVRVEVRPGKKVGAKARVTVDPATAAVVVDNDARTSKGKKESVVLRAAPLDDGRTRVHVTGKIGKSAGVVSERKRVVDGDLLSGHLLAEALTRRGVTFEGPIRVERGDTACPAQELARRESADLSATISDVNTWSNNFMAEMLLKQLGRTPDGRAATWDGAVKAATEALLGLGLPAEGFRVVNGSGLYVATQISPDAMTRLLVAMRQDPVRGPPFEASLALAGKTGTLTSRLRKKATRGKVKAKTGTLDEVVSLSGYIPTKKGRHLAFAVFINDATPKRTGPLRAAIDALVLTLAGL